MRDLLNILTKSLGWLLMLPIRFYRKFISPLTPPSCRFTPTCSEYAIEAITKHGPFKGTWLAIRRVLRCRPGGGSGYDPVP
ncbi:MAG: membrane protein insertion efficiency factor YidD [Bacteroidaceae bacterium]|nr:membrane protein insertion efficiency factor YidD [Bacteroidaceae bacterium]